MLHKTIYKHVGYYNNFSDIQALAFDENGEEKDFISADDVRKYYESNQGCFHKDLDNDNIDNQLILEEETIGFLQMSQDRKYYICCDIDKDDLSVDINSDDEYNCTSYIDLYEFSHIEYVLDYDKLKDDSDSHSYNMWVLHLGYRGNYEDSSLKFNNFDEAYRNLVFQANRADITYLKFVGLKEEILFSL